jgi:hypothetical protein
VLYKGQTIDAGWERQKHFAGKQPLKSNDKEKIIHMQP